MRRCIAAERLAENAARQVGAVRWRRGSGCSHRPLHAASIHRTTNRLIPAMNEGDRSSSPPGRTCKQMHPAQVTLARCQPMAQERPRSRVDQCVRVTDSTSQHGRHSQTSCGETCQGRPVTAQWLRPRSAGPAIPGAHPYSPPRPAGNHFPQSASKWMHSMASSAAANPHSGMPSKPRRD